MLNYLIKISNADPLKSLSHHLMNFAISSTLVVRKSKKFKPEVFFLALVQAAGKGKTSFNSIVRKMSELAPECDLSAVALWKRIQRSPMALERCFTHICSLPVMDSTMKNSPFTRILTEDSSFVKMLKACSDLFPAHGNKYGETAGVKLNLVFDLLTGQPIELSVHKGTQQDKTIGKDLLELVLPGDLVLRDMGYFCMSCLEQIEVLGADWLSRLPARVKATSSSGKTLHRLLSHSKTGIIDRQVTLTDQQKPARLIAVRKSPQQAKKSVRELRQRMAQQSKNPSKEQLERVCWHILVSSVEKSIMSSKELGELYAQRWQIEILFKAWKQSGQQQQAFGRASNYQHMLGLFLSEVVRLALSMTVWCILRTKSFPEKERLSIYKLTELISSRLQFAKALNLVIPKHINIRHLLSEKRTRNCQMISMMKLLG